jgi:hypothetical protein
MLAVLRSLFPVATPHHPGAAINTQSNGYPELPAGQAIRIDEFAKSPFDHPDDAMFRPDTVLFARSEQPTVTIL